MKYSEFKRWLQQQGVIFKHGKGSHLHAQLHDKTAIVPFHGSKEIPQPLANKIKKDLGLK
jgi:mRNA interferase HicA